MWKFHIRIEMNEDKYLADIFESHSVEVFMKAITVYWLLATEIRAL